jgi:tRNA1(Val) A37 N6-methylase TrmN6
VLTTEGTLLGGQVRYRQPAQGFRSGIEPVLLAATIPARSGECVLEAGTGAGPAMLCLSARVPGCAVTAVEIDPVLAALAAENAADNQFSDARVMSGDIVEMTFAAPFDHAPFDHAPFDHAMANPPYHPPDSSPSDDPVRRLAKHGSEALIAAWIGRMAGGLRRRGTLTLIVAAGMAPGCIAAMAAARCSCTGLLPLWPKSNVAAKLVLLRGIKDGRTPFTVHAGLVLHGDDGRYTAEASAILRDGAALML